MFFLFFLRLVDNDRLISDFQEVVARLEQHAERIALNVAEYERLLATQEQLLLAGFLHGAADQGGFTRALKDRPAAGAFGIDDGGSLERR